MAIVENTPPANPSIVFFGDTLGAKGVFPMFFPIHKH